MVHDGLANRLEATADKCRYHAASASDSEVAKTLTEIAAEMEAALALLQSAPERSHDGSVLGSGSDVAPA